MTDPTNAIVVLGIGNVLWADEGFGVRCAEALAQHYEFAEHVTVVDGGTQGLYLLPFVQSADKLLIFDAVDYALPAGTLHFVANDDVPSFLGVKKLSLHQTGFQEVLALAELTGGKPSEILLIGCQPEVLDDFGGSLRPKVRAAMPEALARAVQQLTDWGAAPRLRKDADQPDDCIGIERYETERPSELDACRLADVRFLQPSASDASCESEDA